MLIAFTVLFISGCDGNSGTGDTIVGVWEIEEIHGESPEEALDGWFYGAVSTFLTNGTGYEVHPGDEDEDGEYTRIDFSWTVEGNVLTMEWDNDWADTVHYFSVTQTQLTTYHEDDPEGVWVWTRVR